MNLQPPAIRASYLVTSRKFPTDIDELQPYLGKTYFDIAQAVNERTIGIFDLFQVVTGERWFNPAKVDFNAANIPAKRQTYRQVFILPATAAGATTIIPHNIANPVAFTRIYGTCITNVPDFRPIPYASATVVTNQIEIKANATQIIVINGATAPNITSGIIVIEYLLN